MGEFCIFPPLIIILNKINWVNKGDYQPFILFFLKIPVSEMKILLW